MTLVSSSTPCGVFDPRIGIGIGSGIGNGIGIGIGRSPGMAPHPHATRVPHAHVVGKEAPGGPSLCLMQDERRPPHLPQLSLLLQQQGIGSPAARAPYQPEALEHEEEGPPLCFLLLLSLGAPH